MGRTIGVLASEHVVVGLVENHRIAGPVRKYPDEASEEQIYDLPADKFAQCISDHVKEVAGSAKVDAIGVGVPGIIRDGVVEESPNLQQLKGLHLHTALNEVFPETPALALNDADAVAAGIAATHGQLEGLVRVWTLGTGIGYGRYPRLPGVWEGGHCVVTLDPKERFCGCGGEGHLEGIMGHRAMRLRFLDIEPEEVFENAKQGDDRCRSFVKLWHRALAGATASSIHLDGPGRFYITGPNSRFIDTALLNMHLHQMVKMSSLQGSFFEVIPTSDEIAIIGAAVSAERAADPAGC
ncbi:MAG: ROK family protein [Phycisphaerales bacterium]|nr:ROK family protein [Phycisphaerales bacterium]